MSKEGQLHLCQGDEDKSSTDHISFRLKIIDFVSIQNLLYL